MNRAIVFIDDEREDQASECIEQSRRRYRFIAMMRDWDRALDLLRRHIISAVVFPGRTHGRGRPRDQELGVEDTGIITVRLPAPRAVGRRPVPLTPEWVRELIDSDAPVPPGIDEDSLAAARRIAQHLRDCGR